MTAQTVEIIIPTTGSAERAQSLFEAIDSVLVQSGANAVPRVVLNGTVYDPAVYNALSERTDILFQYEEQGSLPNAIYQGRLRVAADYFGFLDDDDILLKDALLLKLREFTQNPQAEVVVGNGFVDRFGGNKLIRDSFDDCRKEPLTALMSGNWLASCGGLFKTVHIDARYFFELPKYFEWTWIAFNLANDNRRIEFVDSPTFHVRESAGSLSTEDGNIDALIIFTKKMLVLTNDKLIRKRLKRRLGAAYHSASLRALRQGNHRDAWLYHLRSVNCWKNIGYLTYTRHLFKKTENNNTGGEY